MKNKHRFLEIVRFCTGGVISVGVYYITLYALTEFAKIWYPISSIFGSVLMYGISFLFQKFLTFKNKETKTIPKQLILYFSMAIIFLVTNSFLLFVMVEYLHLKYLIAQIFLTCVLSIISYLTTKKIFAH